MLSANDTITQYKHFFRDLEQADLSQLRRLYADNVLFKDPIHQARGLVEFEDYLNAMCAELRGCRFEYLDELIGDGVAYIKWVLHYRHPRPGSRLVSVRGISHLQWREKIEFHENVFDVGDMPHQQLPLIGNVARWLRPRRAS